MSIYHSELHNPNTPTYDIIMDGFASDKDMLISRNTLQRHSGMSIGMSHTAQYDPRYTYKLDGKNHKMRWDLSFKDGQGYLSSDIKLTLYTNRHTSVLLEISTTKSHKIFLEMIGENIPMYFLHKDDEKAITDEITKSWHTLKDIFKGDLHIACNYAAGSGVYAYLAQMKLEDRMKWRPRSLKNPRCD